MVASKKSCIATFLERGNQLSTKVQFDGEFNYINIEKQDFSWQIFEKKSPSSFKKNRYPFLTMKIPNLIPKFYELMKTHSPIDVSNINFNYSIFYLPVDSYIVNKYNIFKYDNIYKKICHEILDIIKINDLENAGNMCLHYCNKFPNVTNPIIWSLAFTYIEIFTKKPYLEKYISANRKSIGIIENKSGKDFNLYTSKINIELNKILK